MLAVGVSAAAVARYSRRAHQTAVGILVGVVGDVTATVFAVITFVRWSVAVPVVMLERVGPVASLRRSWRLVRRSSWRVLGILLATALIVGIANVLINVPFSVAGGTSSFATPQAHLSVVGVIVSAVGGIVATTVTAPLLAGVVVLLYTDLRMRREGMDIKLLASPAAGRAPGRGGHGRSGSRPLVMAVSPVGREAAQRLARDELSRRAIYHQQSLSQSIGHWVLSVLGRLFAGASSVTPGGWWTLVALAALVVAAVALVAARLGPVARSARGGSPARDLGSRAMTARQLRDAAAASAAEGDYAAAIVARLRAIAAACEERGILIRNAGQTADELATQRARAFPVSPPTLPRRHGCLTRSGTAAGQALRTATSGCGSSTPR